MSIKIGDILIMTQDGVERNVEAMSGEHNGCVQIKSNGTYSTCSVHDLLDPYVLVDPSGKGVKSGGVIYITPEAQATEDRQEAKLFRSQGEAIAFRDSHSGVGYFMPRKLND
jgi:hypothetical protein